MKEEKMTGRRGDGETGRRREQARSRNASLHVSPSLSLPVCFHPSSFILSLHPSIGEPLARLRGLGAPRVAAQQLAPRRAVVVKLSLRGVEDKFRAAADLGVESAEVGEVAVGGSLAGPSAQRVEAGAGLARELRGGLFRR